MKTLEQMKKYNFRSMDGRDKSRLLNFVSEDDFHDFEAEITEELKGKHTPIEWTRINIIAQLKDDVEFGFEKALNKRGLSASFMNDVLRMWNHVLEEGLEDFDEYPQYGLPLLKATAIRYGFENQIGNDTGTEHKYYG